MRLSSLEIKGFKSFGEKVVIHFDKGVTAIVGPNGSGKSNVVDAMRWVLGEQKTRMLRSEKMENIIFNGTKTRKQANMAEVSLSFENTKNILPTEYSTVTITRRLYRSGESEYLLNSVPCRLKDITDLFLDTGIGSDSYAIIELKMVDEILNDKHNAIKNLLEEAAGISKYKIRKKQTFNKLEETEKDLNRVNDLLFEIEKNMKSLESQAKKTDRYYKLKEQYKELSGELALFTLKGSKITFTELQEQEEKQLNDKTLLDSQLAETEARLQEVKLLSLDKERELSASQKELNDKTAALRQQENDKKISNEKLKFLQDKESGLSQQIAKDKTSLLSTQEHIRLNEEEKFNEEAVLELLQSQLLELKSELDKTRSAHDIMKSEISRISAAAQSIQSSMHESEKSFAVTQARRDSLEKEIERLIKDNASKTEEQTLLHEQADKSRLHKEDREKALADLVNSEEHISSEIIRLEEELKKVTDDQINDGRKLDARQNEFQLTKSLIENLEGYPESLQFLRKNNSTSNTPLFSEILNCSAEFKTAIENYLDPFMNYFVIDNVDEAGKSINLLSETSKGRANFFILKNFEESTLPHLTDIPGCISALSIIDVEERYMPLCNHLLRNVYVVNENQENTPHLQRNHAGTVFISKNGKFCSTRHTLSGGSVGLFDGKRIGRAKHLETLRKEIDNLSASLELTKRKRDAIQEKLLHNKQQKENFTSDKNRLQQEVNKAVHEFSSLQNKAEHLDSTMANNRKILEDLQIQRQAIDDDTQQNDLSFHEHLELLRTEYETITSQLTVNQEEFSLLSERMGVQSHDYNQHNIQCIQQQNKIATIIRDHEYKQNLLHTLSHNIEVNMVELEQSQQQIRELLETTSGYDEQLLNMYAENKILEEKTNEAEGDLFKTRGLATELEGRIRNVRHQREQCDQLLQAIKDRTNDLKLQLNSLKERLAVEFEIDINELLEKDPSPDWTEEELREKVNKQKHQLDNYGPINPMAVEAFNEINERHVFITTQKADLAQAKESLLKTIEEIEVTARENFMKAFTDIRQNFIKVFRSLFTEDDDCDLVLINPENPTESDVQIIAKPKGKRPLSISQLSGGEKTLTATALLFGIYLLKPAPFCIFDEVDAPLDDMNIDKFNNIIRKFSADSQFIIITHNKRTMTATDIIYGITMVEQGITQVVPVDLTELEDSVA
jgi:chromosome segregation protein